MASTEENPNPAPEGGNPLEFTNRVDLERLRQAVTAIKEAFGSVLVGQQDMVEMLIIAMLAEGHALIEGVPGIAKTLTAKLLARTLDVGFSRIQFTPDLMPSDILGTSVFNPKTGDFEYKKGPVFSNVVLIDEINRAPAKTQAALFEAMAEKQVSMDGVTYPLDPPFLVVATQNPIEQEGTYRLPEAQLDRFLFKIDIGYPGREEEVEILRRKHQLQGREETATVPPVLTAAQIREYQASIHQLVIKDQLLEYIADIVGQTREHGSLYLGASPRASIAIMLTAKAQAAVRGRDFVTPDDIKRVAPYVLGHRIVLTPEREMEGVTPAEVIRQILDGLQVPR
ncbi:MoxR family ATPase [Robiginitalea sp. M366]|uniref:AAA family ATPase n=1 Tax=Robiginitalea aestuariiviva TaxID=3036903 RepID=UPI00240D1AE5|nr:MoxR family ATPase [Robiginitalea aestuariiviva]MDG1572567.1 MoxR family ATPase [Robiginitalea aestuariiviva]